jgi:cyclopropane-fatty-acyl-phospholipid synthase
MPSLMPKIESQLSDLPVPLTLQLPDGRQVSRPGSRITLAFSDWSALAKLGARQLGAIGEAYVEGKVQIQGAMRDLVDVTVGLLPRDPVELTHGWWSKLQRHARSRNSHSLGKDAQQVEFHYDVSDDFYALWLDPRRVYSCAYFRDADMTLAQAQEAKLDHICRKLMLQPGDRYLDIGSGWGALLLWAAEHYGVDATGITLSKNQHAHVMGGCASSCATTACSRRTSPSTRSLPWACSSTWAAPTWAPTSARSMLCSSRAAWP